MVATVADGSIYRLNGCYSKSTAMGVSGPGAGVTSVSSPAPPSPYANWLQFDTAQIHNAIWVNGILTAPSGVQARGWVEQYHIRRDGGTISQACYLRRQGLTTNFAFKWNTAGNLDVYVADVLVCTISFSTSTTAHVAVYMRTLDGVSSAGNSDKTHQVVVYKDGTAQVNRLVTGVGQTINLGSACTLGENAAAGSNTLKYYVLPLVAGYCDWDNPLGKVTVKEWGFTLGGAPVWDESTKSSGTDAAALLDDRPPSGSGTSDPANEYITINPVQMQTNLMANSLLGAGDTLYAVKPMPWSRSTVASKTTVAALIGCTPLGSALVNGAINSSTTSITYDGAGGDGRPIGAPNGANTNTLWTIRIDSEYMNVTADSGTVLTVTRAAQGSTAASHLDNATIRWFIYIQMTTLGGGTSYAEDKKTGGEEAIHCVGPDNVAWSSDTNTYLDKVEWGYGCSPGSNPLGKYAQDALVVEALIILSGDTITLPAPPTNRDLYQQTIIQVPRSMQQAVKRAAVY